MKTRRPIHTAIFLGTILTCASVCVAADGQLLRLWSEPGISVQKRAEAVNRSVTNGTPIRVIVAALGTNYGVLRPFSSVWVGPGPEPRKTCSLFYRFGHDEVTWVVIGTTAAIDGDPLIGKFAGAGYSSPRMPVTERTNRISIGR